MPTDKCCAYCAFYRGTTGAYWAWCEKVKKCTASHECCDKYEDPNAVVPVKNSNTN